MALWRVDVAGVSHRIVDADSAAEAAAAVSDEILDALNLRASLVDAPTQQYFAGLSTRQKRTFIASMDGLASPRVRAARRSARRRLAAWVKYDIKEREWLAAGLTSGRPVDPEGVARILRSMEIERVERIQSRHRQVDRRLFPDASEESGYGA